jgi:hypothetical protein
MNPSTVRLVLRTVFTVLTATGLAVDAYVHFDLAPTYDAIKTGTLSQGDLVRAEAVLALVAASRCWRVPAGIPLLPLSWWRRPGSPRCWCTTTTTSDGWADPLNVRASVVRGKDPLGVG